ncbi:hypothetical protein BDF14DRAFT_1697824, partial [Spinellus fusiger]
DFHALVYVDTPNANLICCICQTPFVDPVISPCGHTFCGGCIYQAIEANPVCPIDRAPLATDQLTKTPNIINNMVNELVVECPHHTTGCPEQTQRQFVQQHAEKCLYAYVDCVLEGCSTTVLKRDSSVHARECPFRLVECDVCHTTLHAHEVERHPPQCLSDTPACHHCHTEQPRAQYTDHLAHCPALPVSCHHHASGCPWQGERRHHTAHTTACPYEAIKGHLQQQQQQHAHLVQTLDALTSENALLRQQHKDLQAQWQGTLEQWQTLTTDPMAQLRTRVDSLGAGLQSLELQQNMALMTETFRLQEEMQSVKAVCHGIRMQMHYLMMDR